MKQVGAWAFFPVLVMSVVPAITAAVAQEAVPPRSIALATASPGGVYRVYGQALAPILSRVADRGHSGTDPRRCAQCHSARKAPDYARLCQYRPELAGLVRNRLGEGNPLSLDARHVPAVRHGVPIRGAQARAKSLDNFTGLPIGGGPRGGTAARTSNRFSRSSEFLPSFGTAPGTILVHSWPSASLTERPPPLEHPFLFLGSSMRSN